MTHISNSLVPNPPSVAVDHPVTTVTIDPDGLKKATYVLGVLRDMGIKMHFDTTIEEMAKVWANTLTRYPIGVLDDTLQDWVKSETDWPTLGEFDAICALNLRELTKASKPKVEREGPCQECDGNRWVRVGDGPDSYDTTPEGKRYVPGKGWVEDPTVFPERILVRNYHMEPCGSCEDMADRKHLYDSGHMAAEHVEAGGCSTCRDYLRHCAKSKKARR